MKRLMSHMTIRSNYRWLHDFQFLSEGLVFYFPNKRSNADNEDIWGLGLPVVYPKFKGKNTFIGSDLSDQELWEVGHWQVSSQMDS